MSDENKVRLAHELLDEINARQDLTPEQTEVLRSFLPELPVQKTLEEIYKYVDDAWLEADDPESKEWLHELHAQLKGLIDTPVTVPALPEGIRLADHEQYGRVITSPKPNRDGVYDLLVPRPKFETGADWEYAHECELTFIDSEPAHPEFLETEQDYENAQVGTVAARDNGLPWVKEKSNYWTRPDAAKSDYGMSLWSRRILRWGNE